MFRDHAMILLIGAALSVLAWGSGCVDEVTFVPPDELPVQIESVRANAADFSPSPDDSLSEVEAGTALDDLQNLDGCWGAFDVFAINDVPVLQDYEFYQFDVAAGTTEWQVLQKAEETVPVPGLSSAVAFVSRAGTFEITDPSQIRVTVTNSTFNDPHSGELVTMQLEPEQVSDFLVTVSGQEMKLNDLADPQSDDRDDLVFKKFGCPAE